MMKKEKGITLIALAVTIIIILIVASIGIGAINYKHKNVIETSEKIADSKTKQDYIDATQMTISKTQLEYATKEIDNNYFEKIKNELLSSEQFHGATIKTVYYDVTSDGVNISENSEYKNAVDIYTKEGYHILVNEDLKVFAADNVKYTETESANIVFEGVPTNWTNQNAMVAIKRGGQIPENSQYTIQYKIGANDTYQKYNSTLNIPENCDIYARIIDKDRRIIAPETKAEIRKIDKIKPTIEKLQVATVCSTVSVSVEVQDQESGISKIIFYAKKTTATSPITKEEELTPTTDKRELSATFELETGTYNIYAEIYDQAGNMKKTDSKQTQANAHNYAYFLGTTNKGTTHPTTEGAYIYKCANNCGINEKTHTITENEDADSTQHYKYKCTCGQNEKENHTSVNGGTQAIHTKCSKCNRVLSTSHSMTNVATSSTCQQCACGYKITSHTPANGGTASVHKKCSVCNYTIEGSSSHSYTIKDTSNASAPCQPGTRTRTCGCGYSYPEELAAKQGHTLGYLSVGTDGTLYNTTTYDVSIHPSRTYTSVYVPSKNKYCSVQSGKYVRACKFCGGKLSGTHNITTYSSYQKNSSYHWKVKCSYNNNSCCRTAHKCDRCGKTTGSGYCGPYGGTHHCTCGASKSASSSTWST